MKSKIITFMVLIMLFWTSSAFASFDDYGYNDDGRIFNGTMENWENFVYGRPAVPYELDQLDVQYLIRRWDENFDAMMFKGAPPVDGAWQTAHMYVNLSGDQLGWTMNESFKMVYSSTPIEGAMTEPSMPGFYVVQYNAWLEDSYGNEITLGEFHSIPPSLGIGLYNN